MLKKLCLIFILVFNLFISSSFAVSNLNISSQAGILIDCSSGKTLYEKNCNEKLYPASLTKILTAIIAIENSNISDMVTVKYEAISNIPTDYITASLQLGETLTVEQLLNLLLIHSANDAANVLSQHIAGSIDSFVAMMNTKATELGCVNSNFVNPNGIHNDNHYSTAYDLSLICNYAMKNEVFKNIVVKKSYTMEATNKHESRTYINYNEMLQNNENATGIKTGYTNLAGSCLASSMKKDNLELICVVLNAPRETKDINYRYSDSLALFNFGFNNFKTIKIVNANTFLKQIKIYNADKKEKELDLYVKDDIYGIVNEDFDDKNFNYEINLKNNLQAPIKKGEIVGNITYSVENNTYSANLIAGNNVSSFDGLQTLYRILLVIILLGLIYWIMDKKFKNKKAYFIDNIR